MRVNGNKKNWNARNPSVTGGEGIEERLSAASFLESFLELEHWEVFAGAFRRCSWHFPMTPDVFYGNIIFVAQVGYQVNKRVKLLPRRSCVVEVAYNAYSNSELVAVTGSAVCSIQLFVPAPADFNLAVFFPIRSVTYDKVVSQTMTEMPFRAVVPVKHAGASFLCCAVVNYDILPAFGSYVLQDASYHPVLGFNPDSFLGFGYKQVRSCPDSHGGRKAVCFSDCLPVYPVGAADLPYGFPFPYAVVDSVHGCQAVGTYQEKPYAGSREDCYGYDVDFAGRFQFTPHFCLFPETALRLRIRFGNPCDGKAPRAPQNLKLFLLLSPNPSTAGQVLLRSKRHSQ